MRVFTKAELNQTGLINNTESVWIIGPSVEVLKYKQFIIDHLTEKNVIAVGHTFPEMVFKWGFTPNFFTWFDPHQMIRVMNNFDALVDKLEGRSIGVAADFVGSAQTFPCGSQLLKDKSLWMAYEAWNTLLSTGCSYRDNISSIYAKSLHLSWTQGERPPLNTTFTGAVDPSDPWANQNLVLANKLCLDPNYRFNQYGLTVFGSQMGKLENFLTHTALPIAHFMGFTNIFVIGFDGGKKRHYKTKNRINPNHRKFHGLKSWLEWAPYHNMRIMNCQPSGPLFKMIPFISMEDSILEDAYGKAKVL